MGALRPGPLGPGVDASLRRLRCGGRVSVRLATPASVAPWGAAPAGLGATGPGLLALVFVEAAPAADPGHPLPPIELRVGERGQPGTTVVAAGPAPDGAAVGWVHLAMGPDLCRAALDGAAVSLHVDAGGGELPLEVPLPSELVVALAKEVWSAHRAGGEAG